MSVNSELSCSLIVEGIPHAPSEDLDSSISLLLILLCGLALLYTCKVYIRLPILPMVSEND